MADETNIAEPQIPPEPPFDNRETVKKIASEISESEIHDAQIKALIIDPTKNIPEGSIVLDIGCGNGAMGIYLADKRNCSLIQADFSDGRSYKVGDLVKIPMAVPGAQDIAFEKPLADIALLVDVTKHTGYGNGWNNEKGEANVEGRTVDLLKLLNGVATGVKPDGFILVANTREDGKKDLQYLRDHIAQNPGLEQKIRILG